MFDRLIGPPARRTLRLLRSGGRQTPLFALRLPQLAPRRNARKLLQQQSPLAPAAQSELTNQLLIPRTMPRRALNQAHQFTISLWIGSVCHRLREYSEPPCLHLLQGL